MSSGWSQLHSIAFAAAVISFSADAFARDVCTFNSTNVLYDQQRRDHRLAFSWDKSTGLVETSGSGCSPELAASGGTAYWETETSQIFCGLSSPAGLVEPGFDTNINNRRDVSLYLSGGLELNGTLHGGAWRTDTPAIFAGAYYGSRNALLTAYGTVSCARAPYRVPASIADDCSRDVSSELTAWIASVPDESAIEFGNQRCYNVGSAGITIDDKNGLWIKGHRSTFRTTGYASGSTWRFRGGSALRVEDVIVRGAHPSAGARPGAYDNATEFQHGFMIEALQGGVFERVEAYDVYGDFFAASHDTRVAYPGVPSRNIVVRQANFERNGRQGVSLVHVDNFTLEQSHIGEVAWAAVDLELDEDVVSYPTCGAACPVGRNIKILNNTFGPIWHSLVSNWGRGTSASVGDVTVEGNQMLAPAITCSPAVWVKPPRPASRWSGYTFRHNTLITYGNGFDLEGVNNVRIEDNTIRRQDGGGCGREAAAWLKNIQTGSVQRNLVLNAYPGYLMLQTDAATTGLTVSDNVLQSPTP